MGNAAKLKAPPQQHHGKQPAGLPHTPTGQQPGNLYQQHKQYSPLFSGFEQV